MKKFPHQQFIEDNQLDIQTLPMMLQKRIRGFDELEEDLQHTTDEDKEKLLSKLETLSHELAEDLEEHFEEYLENNDQEEDEQLEITSESGLADPPSKPEVPAEPILEQEPEILEEPVVEQEPKILETTSNQDIQSEAVIEPTDEEILERLLSTKKYNVLPAELKDMGFKTSLNNKKLLVGKFCLRKGKYDACYKIILKSE